MYEIYTFKENDTIDEVAKKFDTTRDELYQLNGFSDDFVLIPNMQLVVPNQKNKNYWYYTVKKGDTFFMGNNEY